MIRSLSEQEFIAENGEHHYMEICNVCYNLMRYSPEYKNNQPVMFSMMMFDWQFNDGRVGHIIIESTIKKLERIKIGADYYGIITEKHDGC